MPTSSGSAGLSLSQRCLKRGFDLLVSFSGLLLLSWLIGITYLIASIDTKANGFFLQSRVGKNGKYFNVIKIKTMRPVTGINTTVTRDGDPRITKLGFLIRKYKLDELPQLINVFFGQMSLVGPRPDVPGFADKLTGDDRIILTIRPGITGPATLAYRDEEKLLAEQDDPETYNKKIIYPEKVKINREYIENYSFFRDIVIIYKTIFNTGNSSLTDSTSNKKPFHNQW